MKQKPLTQVEQCQQLGRLPISYSAFFKQCEERAARGEQQRLCAVCRRWQWPGEECPDFKECTP